MAEKSYNVIPNRTYQPGTHELKNIVVDDDIDHIVIILDRSDWSTVDSSEEPILSWQLWRSEDGGVTWLDAGASSVHGGLLINDNGLSWAVSKWAFSLPPGINRRLWVIATITRRTKLSLDIDCIIRSAG